MPVLCICCEDQMGIIVKTLRKSPLKSCPKTSVSNTQSSYSIWSMQQLCLLSSNPFYIPSLCTHWSDLLHFSRNRPCPFKSPLLCTCWSFCPECSSLLPHQKNKPKKQKPKNWKAHVLRSNSLKAFWDSPELRVTSSLWLHGVFFQTFIGTIRTKRGHYNCV